MATFNSSQQNDASETNKSIDDIAADLDNLVYDPLATHKIREKVIFVVNKAKGVLPEFDKLCNIIGRIFKMGDKIIHIIRAGSFRSGNSNTN